MHLGARGFVHPELIDPETGAAVPIDDGASGELVLTHLRHRAAPLLRFRTRDHVVRPDEPVPVRAHRPARALHRPHRRHADRPRRQRLPVRACARSSAPSRPTSAATSSSARARRASSRTRRCRSASSSRRARRPIPRSRTRSARDCAQTLVVQARVDLVPWGSLQRSEYKSKLVEHETTEDSDAKAPEPGRPPHHHRRRRPQTSIDFWEGVLGMPFVFEQPNLDNEAESHLYFDPGDGRLITVFTNEDRVPDPDRTPTDPGCVHHLAFAVSQATFYQAVERLDERGIRHSGVKDRGFMDSIYFEDPLGLLIELASYRFEPPARLHPRRGAARGPQAPRRARRLQHRPRAPRRRDRGHWSGARASRSRTTARPRTRTTTADRYRGGRREWPNTR